MGETRVLKNPPNGGSVSLNFNCGSLFQNCGSVLVPDTGPETEPLAAVRSFSEPWAKLILAFYPQILKIFDLNQTLLVARYFKHRLTQVNTF